MSSSTYKRHHLSNNTADHLTQLASLHTARTHIENPKFNVNDEEGMKNYVELSTVVIFAILVHSALTASLVNIFMTLHGVGGGGGGKGEGVEKWGAVDGDLYALRMNGGDSCSSDDSSSSSTGQAGLESYNFQQQQSSAAAAVVAKKKIIVSDYETTISLETYSAMLMKQRQSNNSEEETIESLRLKAKQSKFRYMR